MGALKRLTTSIVSSFDWMVTQVENHEALVASAIREVSEAAAKATVSLKRVNQDGIKMRIKLKELREAEEQWKERAINSAKEDEVKALECLKRRKALLSQISILEVQEREHANIEMQLASDLKQVEERLEHLKSKRNLFKTRASRAEALKAANCSESDLIGELGDIFDRWETKITSYEIQSSFRSNNKDNFEDEFLANESEQALKAELQLLITNN